MKAIEENKSLKEYISGLYSIIETTASKPEKIVVEISKIDFRNNKYFLTLVEYSEQRGRKDLVASVQGLIPAHRAQLVHEFEREVEKPLSAGMKVLVTVRPNCSIQFGMKLEILHIDPSYSIGDMQKELRRIRTSLKEKGIYGRNKSKELPFDYFKIAIICPADSAGLGDFNEKLRDIPASLLTTQVLPVTFQSNHSGKQIAEKILHLNADSEAVDAIIILRGGGNKSTLDYLNSEVLAEAVCLSSRPIYSAVGHHMDRTIIDEVAAVFFATPSLAATHIRERILSRSSEVYECWKSIHINGTRRLSSIESKYENGWLKLKSEVAGLCRQPEQEMESAWGFVRSEAIAQTLRLEHQLVQGGQWLHTVALSSVESTQKSIDMDYKVALDKAKEGLVEAQYGLESVFKSIEAEKEKAILEYESARSMKQLKALVIGLSIIVLIGFIMWVLG